MDNLYQALCRLHRHAAWLEELTRAAVELPRTFTESRAKKISAACTAVQKAHAEYEQALRSACGPHAPEE